MAVQKFVRVGAAVLAVGLVGYAVFIASQADPDVAAEKSSTERAKPRARPAGSKVTPPSSATPRRSGAAGSQGSSQGGAEGGAAAGQPPIEYEKTLDELETFVNDLESMQKRKQTLPQPEWVERYRKGSELVDALMRAPEVKEQDRVRDEVVALNMRFRSVIQDILAKPGPP